MSKNNPKRVQGVLNVIVDRVQQVARALIPSRRAQRG